MPAEAAASAESPRNPSWKWWVCGLLFLATVINYMDRQTLSQTAVRIKTELDLTNTQYGQVETAFGLAFACGALIVGWSVDRWNVRWIYPAILVGWSAAGFATGFARTFMDLVWCRLILGLLEAGNWPCALRTTQRILPSVERTLGNSILQSGAAIGAVFTPLVVLALVDEPGTWSHAYFVIGAGGMLWVFLWLPVVKSHDLALPKEIVGDSANDDTPEREISRRSILDVYLDRRFLVCVVICIAINQTWHFFRVWLPLYLQEGRRYDAKFMNLFMSAFYFATYLGTLSAGFITLFLRRAGLTVHKSRIVVFLGFALLTSLSVLVAYLPTGPLMLGLLLVLGFGALGLFPVYYSLTQELTFQHQGKVNGALAFLTWTTSAIMHPIVGKWFDETKNYSLAVGLAGLAPMLGFLVLIIFWRSAKDGVEAVLSPLVV